MGQLKTYGDVVKFDLSSGAYSHMEHLRCKYKYKTYTFNEIYNLVIERYVNFINNLISGNGIITPEIDKQYNNITSDMSYLYTELRYSLDTPSKKYEFDKELAALNAPILKEMEEEQAGEVKKLEDTIEQQSEKIKELNELIKQFEANCEDLTNNCNALNEKLKSLI